MDLTGKLGNAGSLVVIVARQEKREGREVSSEITGEQKLAGVVLGNDSPFQSIEALTLNSPADPNLPRGKMPALLTLLAFISLS